MQNKCPNVCTVPGAIYTAAKIRVYALKCTYVLVSQITVYMPAGKVPFHYMAARV